MSKRHIAIIGAGPSGLALARILQCHTIPFALYERDGSSGARLQGGSLDLHPESGQLALNEGGLLDEFNKYARYQDQDYRVLDKDGKEWMNHKAPPQATGRPEIDRPLLRKILVDSIEPQHLKWNHHVLKIQERDDDRFEVHFANRKETAVADLVVGADGTWSKVRSLLTDIRPVYAGMTMVDCRLSDIDEKYPDLGKFAARGNTFCFSDSRGLMLQRNGDGSLRVYACMNVPEGWGSDPALDWKGRGKIKEILLDHFKDWDQHFKDILQNVDPKITPWPIFRLPLGFRWKTHKGLTLIGDAAHVVSPFAGEGVNLAMLDSVNLSHAILENPSDFEAAVRKYEPQIGDRADDTNRVAQALMEQAMESDAPKTYAAEMAKAMESFFADGRLPE